MKKIFTLVLALCTGDAIADDSQFIIRVDGVTCPFCVATSERTLAKIKGVHSVNSDLKLGIIYVCADDATNLSAVRLRELFSKRGFTYRSVRKSSGCNDKSVRNKSRRKAPPKHDNRAAHSD